MGPCSTLCRETSRPALSESEHSASGSLDKGEERGRVLSWGDVPRLVQAVIQIQKAYRVHAKRKAGINAVSQPKLTGFRNLHKRSILPTFWLTVGLFSSEVEGAGRPPTHGVPINYPDGSQYFGKSEVYPKVMSCMDQCGMEGEFNNGRMAASTRANG